MPSTPSRLARFEASAYRPPSSARIPASHAEEKYTRSKKALEDPPSESRKPEVDGDSDVLVNQELINNFIRTHDLFLKSLAEPGPARPDDSKSKKVDVDSAIDAKAKFGDAKYAGARAVLEEANTPSEGVQVDHKATTYVQGVQPAPAKKDDKVPRKHFQAIVTCAFMDTGRGLTVEWIVNCLLLYGIWRDEVVWKRDNGISAVGWQYLDLYIRITRVREASQPRPFKRRPNFLLETPHS
ncbi:hypothetical protein CONPUDRAFT_75391 [Coniophora puteana RWD-64-598 SS2]|uniref:Uncharacterized protein n=1 Tax=Coniophora puteana (strain RWD-64-598) TaxID=741705 RepID=A0A5M3ME72_CONPW|nr:uncharacterized protein CONPUDRAFT_75391 [Coniophora puteana RWD-64-598 SS2]EIW77528.1 hypothetical protein CONPUDRAFT_75391 [Coniophora puteana RWD-64-598 SS2]